MSLKLLKAVSRLCEQNEFELTQTEYSDIIHGRTGDSRHHYDVEDVPLQPVTTPWEALSGTEGETLERNFRFLNFKTLTYFVSESLKHQNTINHHCVIVIDELSVKCVLQTKNVKEVTELDKELAEYLDEIYKDTQYFYPVNE